MPRILIFFFLLVLLMVLLVFDLSCMDTVNLHYKTQEDPEVIN